ncbi:Acyl-ACP thioesterase [Caloramator quimbayensis]|uniref:Acyl-ACP thioesterase n=1 Tax=Caloramator quimbayensis TaxID=1147123 RepID=A0A1T4XZG1_9CLOT|nr:acyl-ACP thioesterase domain-containing protein [Caloramator quimbayensis]SKA94967.1 Acyl-ACP thioesterase [Caloramator quimbayensis]
MKYSKEFSVYYSDVDRFNKSKTLSILNYLEETAMSHSLSVGLGFEKLYNEGFAWILAAWHVEIDRAPSFNEKITVKTWPVCFDKYFAYRHFKIIDEMGNVIVSAASKWVLLDINKRRAVKIPNEIKNSYIIDEETATKQPFMDFKKIEVFGDKKQFDIRRSDIDTNNHVNNKKYVEWAIETVPYDIYDNYYLSSFDVLYKRETEYGNTVLSYCMESYKDENSAEYYHAIKSEDELELALIFTNWKRRY